MKKTVKLINILLIVFMILFSFTNVVNADSTTGDIATGIFDQMNPTYEDDAGLGGIGGTIINWISVAGIVIAVIVLAILGVKYMVGSASEKAEYKKTMIPYLVGAVLVFGASAIAQVVVNMASGLVN